MSKIAAARNQMQYTLDFYAKAFIEAVERDIDGHLERMSQWLAECRELEKLDPSAKLPEWPNRAEISNPRPAKSQLANSRPVEVRLVREGVVYRVVAKEI